MKKLFTYTVSGIGIAALGILAWSLVLAVVDADGEETEFNGPRYNPGGC